LVYSSSIGKENWLELGALDSQLFPYDGIDEVAWLIDFSPKEETLDALGLSKNDKFIVARPEESSAAYMLERKMPNQTLLDEILDEIFIDYDGKAVVFPRYERQKEVLLNKFKDRIIIPPKAVDTLSLYYFSDLCITGGATMAREAAALGTPSISYYPKPLEVLEYITSIGIPLFNEYSLQEAITKAKDLLANPVNKTIMRNQVKSILEKLESPTDKVVEILSQEYQLML
jgi:predicted glycosyltransferase